MDKDQQGQSDLEGGMEESIPTPAAPTETAELLKLINSLNQQIVELRQAQATPKVSDAEAIRRVDAEIIAQEKRVSKMRPYKEGEVAHQHDYEDSEYNITKRPCLAVPYNVRHPEGLFINEIRYHGRVVVPQCVANYLNWMDQEAWSNELAIHTNKGRPRDLGELRNSASS